MSVPLSAVDLGRQYLPSDIRDVAEREGIAPSRLRVQIAESTLVGGGERLAEQIAELSKLDVRTEVRDFGTALSSLSYLCRASIDAVRISPAFVSGLDHRGEAFEIIRAMITVAHDLSMKVVAEGIETHGQRSALLSLGCDYGQGPFFTQPLDVLELDWFLRTRAR
jgi:EAL domain-containing protein (putative c-di-GMP-specific phosphodiesterase class I)